MNYKETLEDYKRKNKFREKMFYLTQRAMMEKSLEEILRLKEIRDIYVGKISDKIIINNPFNKV